MLFILFCDMLAVNNDRYTNTHHRTFMCRRHFEENCKNSSFLTSTRGAKLGHQTRNAVKGCGPEITSMTIWDHNLGAHPCQSPTGNLQDGFEHTHLESQKWLIFVAILLQFGSVDCS